MVGSLINMCLPFLLQCLKNASGISPDATSTPPAPLEPPAVVSSLRPTIRQTSQHSELRIECTSCDATLTTFITVTLREVVPNFAPPSSSTMAAPSFSNSSPRDGPALSAPQLRPSMEIAREGGGSAPGDAQVNSSELYTCRIVEEDPSPTHGS